MAVPTHNDVQFKIRIPADLKERVDAAAKANSRSTTAEIVAALEEKYPAPKHFDSQRVAEEFFYRIWRLDPKSRAQFMQRAIEVAEQSEAPLFPADTLRELFHGISAEIDRIGEHTAEKEAELRKFNPGER